MDKLPRGLKVNNPGNIRNTPRAWEGEIRPSKDHSFKTFESIAYGYRAMFMLLNNYQRNKNLNTIAEMIDLYAPPEDGNRTDLYIQHVADWSGIDADMYIDTDHRETMIRIVASMSRQEQGIIANMNEVIEGWNLYITIKKRQEDAKIHRNKRG